MRRFKRIALLVLGIGFLYPVTGQAQAVRSLTVEESVRLGLERNEALLAARADADAADAAHRQVQSNRLPSLSGQASYMRLSDNIPEISFESDLIPGLDTSYTLAPVELNQFHSEISINQPVFTGLRLHNEIQAAGHEAASAEHAASQEEANVAFRIRQAYWRLHEALALLEATDDALARAEAHLENVQNRREAGAALMSDVLAARTRVSEVRLEQVDAANAVRVARLALNRLLGLPLDTEVQLSADVAMEPLPAEVDSLVARAQRDRPSINVLHAQVDASQARVESTHGVWFPEVSLNGRYVYARPNQYFFTEREVFRATWEAGVVLRWNIWDGGAKLARTRQARARLQRAEARLSEARENAAVEVMQQYLEAERATEAVAVAEQNVEEAEESLRIVRRQYAEGAALAADVLDAEQALRGAEARHVQATADYAVARAALLNAVGEVW